MDIDDVHTMYIATEMPSLAMMVLTWQRYVKSSKVMTVMMKILVRSPRVM